MNDKELKALKKNATIVLSQAKREGWTEDDNARMLAEGTLKLIADYQSASALPLSIQEALNSGDGVYRP
jgi:hypothetical protein